jgi:DNA-directed RNA polymerase alpha subunit
LLIEVTLLLQSNSEEIERISFVQHSIEAKDDVIKLLNDLKELTFKMHKVQYGYWTICQTVRRVLTMRQQDNEPLAEY